MDFKTMTISFCKKSGDNVVEADSKQQILDILFKKYNVNFKSNRAMILNQKSLSFLKNNPHLISIKSTGSNYFLFFTRINNTNCVFYIDRKVKKGYTLPRIISVNYRFDDEIYNDTLLDGELVKDKHDNWMFLISDLIVSKGTLLKTNIVKRFNELYTILETNYVEDSYLDICPLRVKRLFNYRQYNELITCFVPSLSYGIRGLYFNTLNPKYHNQLFIYKESNTKIVEKQISKDEKINTYRIKTTVQPEIYDLYHNKGNILTKMDVARIPNIKASKLLRKLFSKNEDETYVKCKFNNKFNKWEPFEEGLKEDLEEE